ncbi:MAG: hypothetical protein HN791_07465 [Gammaproteobacteria bacterium]|jgi:hypothetical protein|nr:hypothetical protein [Gammaproteobacteria bacterium]
MVQYTLTLWLGIPIVNNLHSNKRTAMNFDFLLIELILRIISYAMLVFGGLAIFVQYTSGRLISQLEMRLHYFSNRDGKRVLHIPPLGEPKVWEVFDPITALWILFRARAWAKNSEGKQILIFPSAPMIPWLSALFPSKSQMFQRLRIYLQSKAQQPDVWVRRASDSVCKPKAEGDEIEYQFFLAIEHSNPEAKAIYVHILAVDTINEIIESNGAFANVIHLHWSYTEERINILSEGCKFLQNIRNKPEDERNLTIWL